MNLAREYAASLCVLGSCLAFTPHVSAQESPNSSTEDEIGEPAEIFPDYLARRIMLDEFEAAVEALGVEHGVIAGAKAWSSMPISVCFWGGSTAVRKQIVATAAAWEGPRTGVALDFGNRENPRLCDGRTFAQIRVGYSQPGYWSFIGADSIVHAMQSETSLNLSGFDRRSVPDEEFRRVVLHEFGHALGFRHEHQSPEGACAFDWDAVYAYLSGPPNHWSRETVDQNMRAQPYLRGDVATSFDRASIMLYSFRPELYVGGTSNPCYTRLNTALSTKDIALAAHVYGGTPAMIAQADPASPASSAQVPAVPGGQPVAMAEDLEAEQIAQAVVAAPKAPESVEIIRAALRDSSSRIPAEERALIEARLGLLEADQDTQARIIGAVRPQYVDVDLFACASNEATSALFRDMVAAVSAQAYLGRLRERTETFPSRPAVPSGISVVVDAGHDESEEGQRLVDALETVFPGEVQLVPNEGGVSSWYISIVACKP